MKNLLLIALLSLSLVSCKKKYNEGYNDAAAFYSDMMVKFSLFQQNLSINDGSHIAFVKLAEDDKNFVVFSYLGFYYAIDFTNMTEATAASYADLITYLSTNDLVYGLTDNGNGTFSCNNGTCFTSTTGADVSAYAGFVFESTSATSKDLEMATAVVEKAQTIEFSKGISAELGLSEERSLEVARITSQMNNLYKNRSMTNADLNVFVSEVIGTDLKTLDAAYSNFSNGNVNAFDKVIENASEVNGVEAEQAKKILLQLL